MRAHSPLLCCSHIAVFYSYCGTRNIIFFFHFDCLLRLFRNFTENLEVTSITFPTPPQLWFTVAESETMYARLLYTNNIIIYVFLWKKFLIYFLIIFAAVWWRRIYYLCVNDPTLTRLTYDRWPMTAMRRRYCHIP